MYVQRATVYSYVGRLSNIVYPYFLISHVFSSKFLLWLFEFSLFIVIFLSTFFLILFGINLIIFQVMCCQQFFLYGHTVKAILFQYYQVFCLVPFFQWWCHLINQVSMLLVSILSKIRFLLYLFFLYYLLLTPNHTLFLVIHSLLNF